MWCSVQKIIKVEKDMKIDRTKSIGYILGLLLISTSVSKGQAIFSNDLSFGPHPIGFKAVQTIDYTRAPLPSDTKTPPAGRAMHLHIWYPAEKTTATPMLYRDYLALRFPKTASIRNGFMQSVAELGGDTSLFQPVYSQLVQSKTPARQGVKIASGHFPLVLFPDQVHLQNSLCEYLASWGFIVASPSVQGTFSSAMQYNVAGIETGVADLEFALGYLRKNYPVKRQFAAMGIGFSATLALALQMRNPEMQALVSLEGGITTSFEANLIQRSPYYELERCTAPMLVIHAPHPDVKPELVDRYKYAERIFQHYPQSSEFYFLNFGLWERHLKNILPKANHGNTWQSFAQAAQSIQLFLHWQLNQQEKAREALFQGNEPKEIVHTTLKPAVLLPSTYTELLDLLQKQGFTALADLYNERKKQDPQAFSFSSFFQIGQQLIGQNAYPQLLEWAKLFAEAYPQSAIPFTLQGRANLELGQKQEAKLQYEKALGLLPQDSELNEGEKTYYKSAIESRINSLG